MTKGKKRKGRHTVGAGSGGPRSVGASSGGGGGGANSVGGATEQALETLTRLHEQLAGAEGDGSGPLWGQVHRALLKAHAPARDASRVVIGRNVDALKQLMGRMRSGTTAPAPIDEATEGPIVDVPNETKRKAMKDFRRRLKLTKLDHESKLGVGPMTSGRTADFESILPPHQYDDDVWKALVADGLLRSTGRGFYALPEG